VDDVVVAGQPVGQRVRRVRVIECHCDTGSHHLGQSHHGGQLGDLLVGALEGDPRVILGQDGQLGGQSVDIALKRAVLLGAVVDGIGQAPCSVKAQDSVLGCGRTGDEQGPGDGEHPTCDEIRPAHPAPTADRRAPALWGAACRLQDLDSGRVRTYRIR